MNGVRCFLRQQQCQVLSFKSFLGNPKLSSGRCVLVAHVKNPIGFSCKSIQTSSYEVVEGSYKPTTVVALAEEETNTKELAAPLKIYLEKFPDKKCLHPYERSLVELTLGDGNYEESLSKREAEERLNQGTSKIEEIFRCKGKAVDELVNIAKTLRAMPVVQLETPTLCLVGAPNVGKSSLVRLLSSGKPEICNYPFTTRGILMGHIVTNHQRFQVTDTPGLLSRSDVLSHLPTAILFVHDLSGECGTSPSDQCMIYKEIRSRFNDHLWLDVVSKCDLLRESPVVFASEETDIDDSEVIQYRKEGPDGAIRMSMKTEEGLDELKQRVRELLVAQMERIRSKEHVTDLEALV